MASSLSSGRAARWILAVVFLGIFASCFGGLDPYHPRRPGLDASYLDDVTFPEREILRRTGETPVQQLEQITQVFRTIALAVPDDYWNRNVLHVEIDSIRAEIGRLDLGAKARMRLRLGGLSETEKTELARAAELYMRWGIAGMRSGIADDRVRGADLLREAVSFDSDNEMLRVLLAEYLDLAGFRSNSIRELQDFARSNPQSVLVDLAEIRKRERLWKLRAGEHEEIAHQLCDSLLHRLGGEEAPAWIKMEKARLCFLSDSLEQAVYLTESVLTGSPEESDSLSIFYADLLLGVLETQALEYESAEKYFESALALAQSLETVSDLRAVLSVPWDLWFEEERATYDTSLERRRLIDTFWRQHDPIWATPDLLENKVEYFRRVGESYFRFLGVDPRRSPSLTDPGRAVLRFGWPDEWLRKGQTAGSLPEEEGTILTWVFHYDRDDRPPEKERQPQQGWDPPRRDISFHDEAGGRAWMAASDSLIGAEWPPRYFNPDFLGRSYPFSKSVAQFREPSGRTRLYVSFDTLLPNYSVRFPLQGYRYNGSVSVDAAVLRFSQDRWSVGWTGQLPLAAETTLNLEREFRRVSGASVFPGVTPGVYRVASFLSLRDPDGRIVQATIDNGVDEFVEPFGWDRLEASDLLLTSSLGEVAGAEPQRTIREDLVIYGPDLGQLEILPRADRRFLLGESLSFYLEVYNLSQRKGVTSVDVETSLEKLDWEGEVEFSVSLTGQSSSLIRFGVHQWNLARSLGLGELSVGRYNLRVDVFDREARQRLSRVAPFQVIDPEYAVEIFGWRELERPSPVMRSSLEGE